MLLMSPLYDTFRSQNIEIGRLIDASTILSYGN